MYNFDQLVERQSDKCRKWDKGYIETKFGPIPDDFIPMWIADMDFQSAPEIIAKFRQMVEHGTFSYTYSFDEFYEAVIQFQRIRHQARVERAWITLTYGTVSTLHYTAQAFCQAGDAILMNSPVYDPFESAAIRQGVQVIKNPLVVGEDGRYYLDFALLEQQMVDHKPTLYFFCSPHNPGGRIWEKAEIERVAELCLKHQVILMVDEVHAEHIIRGQFSSAFHVSTDLQQNMIVLTSPNKGFNLGGLKTSYSIIPNPLIRQRFRTQLERNSITSPNMFGIWGIVTAYNEGLAWLDAVTDYIRGNYHYFVQQITTHLPQWRIMPMESSYLVWVDVSQSGMNAKQMTQFLVSNAGVIVEDGSHYVGNGENYIRINLGTSRELVEKALARIIQALDKRK